MADTCSAQSLSQSDCSICINVLVQFYIYWLVSSNKAAYVKHLLSTWRKEVHVCWWLCVDLFRCPQEVLKFRKFSHSSDVWAFGITVLELFSYGMEPWPGLNGAEVREQDCNILEQLQGMKKFLINVFQLSLGQINHNSTCGILIFRTLKGNKHLF